MHQQNSDGAIFFGRFLRFISLIVFGTLAACTVSTPPSSPVPSVSQPVSLTETGTPFPSATVTPTATVSSLLSATATAVTPAPTPTETPAVIWVENQGLVAVLPGNNLRYSVSPWSPVADELFFLSYIGEHQQSLQISKAPDFQPTPLATILDVDDLIWMPDGQGVMCTCQLPGTEYYKGLLSIDQNGEQTVFQAGGILHFLTFGDWLDAQRLVCENYAGGGHNSVRILNSATGQFESWGAYLHGGVYPSHHGYIPATNDQVYDDLQVLVIAAQFPFYEFPYDFSMGGNIRLLPDFEGRRWPEVISKFDDWRATSDQMLVYWGYVDQDTTVYHLLLWDVAQNTLGLLAPNGMGGEFSPDGRLLAYLTEGPALLDEAARPVPYPLGSERQPGVYLQVMELAGGTVQLSLPTYSRFDIDDPILDAHSFLQGGFSPDSRYLAFLTPGLLQLDISGWPAGVDASQPDQVYLNLLDWPARQVVWSGLTYEAARIEWSPLSDHLLYQDQTLNWQLLDLQRGITTQLTAQVSGQVNVTWSNSGRYASLGGGEQIHIYDITHGILPGQRVALESIFMWDAQNGWGLADGNQLVHTIDGGRTWQWAGQTDTALSFYATGPSSGRVEVAGAAWETQDGCLTWQPSVLASAPDGRTWVMHGEDYFLDAQVGWQLNSGEYLMRTVDGGQTWTNIKNVTWKMAQFSFVDEQTGWALVSGGDNPQTILVFTINGGLTWQEIEPLGRG